MAGGGSSAELAEARRRGDVAVSRRLAAALGLGAGALSLLFVARNAWDSCGALLRRSIALASAPEPPSAQDLGRDAMLSLASILATTLAPLVVAFALGALAGSLIQGGLCWRARRAKERPLEPYLRVLLGCACALALTLLLAHLVLRSSVELQAALEPHLALSRPSILEGLGRVLDVGSAGAAAIVTWTVLACAAFGALDAVIERAAWRRRQSSSSADERRQQRAREVAPEVRAARREAHKRLAALR